MRAENAPPSRRSTVLRVVCQLSCGEFHCTMSSGLFQTFQTALAGAFTTVSTVIFMAVLLEVVGACPLAERGSGQSTGTDENSIVEIIALSSRHAKTQS